MKNKVLIITGILAGLASVSGYAATVNCPTVNEINHALKATPNRYTAIDHGISYESGNAPAANEPKIANLTKVQLNKQAVICNYTNDNNQNIMLLPVTAGTFAKVGANWQQGTASGYYNCSSDNPENCLFNIS